MADLLCNTDVILKFSIPSIVGIINVSGSPLSTLSIKTKIDNLPLFHNLTFTVSGATNGVCSAASGMGTIMGSTIKNKENGLSFVTESDQVTITLTGSGMCTFPATIQVLTPGQTKVRGE